MSASPPAVDVLGIVYDEDCWGAYLHAFARDAPSYLRLFAGRFAALTGVDVDDYRRALERDPHAAVDLVVATGRLGVDIDVHAAALRQAGVVIQVLAGGADRLPDGTTMNDRVAGFARRHPDVLTAWAGVSLRNPEGALDELRRGVRELGMTGALVTHFLDEADPLADASFALYAEAERLGVPLWIHTGHNLSRHASMATCTWRELDEIARRHPQLRIVAGHGGWPWVLEMVSLCHRHPHVYLELSTHRGAHIGRVGSGWEPLLLYGATTIRRKVLFGSCTWVHGRSERELADEVAALPLAEPVVRAWLHDNGARLVSAARSQVARDAA